MSFSYPVFGVSVVGAIELKIQQFDLFSWYI